MLSQKSVLARLLSNENITVQQGNFPTAFFDTKDRVLGLPLWKQMNNDVYDLLVGHEVGHALYTPENFCEYEGYNDVPHSWTNIVEDIRIERLQLQKYPGLVGNFKRGYYYLFNEMDLFGVKGQDLSELNFMDRLNLYSKSRGLVDIHFDEDELPYVAKAMGVQTYENVISVCKEIAEWLGTEDEDESEEGKDMPSMMDQSSDESDDDQEQDSNQSDEESEEEQKMSGGEQGEEDDSEESSSDNAGEASDLDDQDSQDNDDEGAPVEPKDELGEAQTDVNFQENQSDLVDGSMIYAQGLSREFLKASTVSYEEIAKARKERFDPNAMFKPKPLDEGYYSTWLSETKKVVNLMVKEFEMRKAAYRTIRARTSTRGSLDVNKLHRYKYDDQLFKQVTRLADSKNHGMIMLTDYSGSMYHMLPAVLKQTITLSMFCKRVGIPFEVYGFTSDSSDSEALLKANKAIAKPTSMSFDCNNLVILETLSSTMPKRQYEEAIKSMFHQSYNKSVASGLESLGNTPLNAALMAMRYKVEDFRKAHNVEKMSLITLTDGDSNYGSISYGTNNKETLDGISRGSVTIDTGGKTVKISRYGANRDQTEAFVKMIRDMDVTCINYFICSNTYELNGELKRTFGWNDKEAIKSARSEVRKQGAAVLDENGGYNRRFIIDGRGNEMEGAIDKLDVDSDMTANKIAKAFTKSNGSKKKSRIITQKFAEMVA